MFQIHAIEILRGQLKRAKSAAGRSWAVSLIFHTILLVLLACFVLPAPLPNSFLIFNSHRSRDIPFEISTPMSVAMEPEIRSVVVDALVDIPALTPTSIEVEPLPVLARTLDRTPIEDDLRIEIPNAMMSIDQLPNGRKRPWDTRQPTTTASISAVNGVAAALGPIEQAIRDEVAQGDTLVVWLMDASISLQLNRQIMATQLAEFQISIGLANRQDGLNARDSSHRLFNSVIAFGRDVMEIQGPTLTGLRAVERMARLPSDASGVELTMNAVNRVVSLYRGKYRRRERMMIVILTDESGDDGAAVEGTIVNCRQHGVAVHVIGPTAVMGLEEGSQLWTTHANGQPCRFLLKVKRGPETCLPERAFMPYWHETRLSAWRPDVRPANSVPWYGGEYREGVLSGFGPYTLTRLALQTGGSYTLYDQGDRARYDRDSLRSYFPEYGSLVEYQASIRDRPLRMFVAETAAVTLRESEVFLPLQMMFFGSRGLQYPFAPQSAYIDPSKFRHELRDALNAEMPRAERAAQRISKLLAQYDERDLEYEYAKEDSPRWKAWYDLNRGRLLAAAVRYDEYIAACEFLLRRGTRLGENVNEILLGPGSEYRVPSSESRARQAMQLLERCRDENPSTPWADLAVWEMATGFGISINTKVIPKPPPPSHMNMGFSGMSMGLQSTGGGGGQSFSFPSL